LAKKTELNDLQRLSAVVDHKVDMGSFETLMRALDSKADRSELQNLALPPQQHLSQQSKVERSELEKLT